MDIIRAILGRKAAAVPTVTPLADEPTTAERHAKKQAILDRGEKTMDLVDRHESGIYEEAGNGK